MKSKEEILDLLEEYGLSRIREALESLLLPAMRINLHQVCDPLYYLPPSMTQMFVNEVRVYPPVPTAPAFDTLPIGASKIAGHPDLPPDFVWPYDAENEPLEFFAQLNFAEIAAVTPLDPLPRTGFLFLFLGPFLGLEQSSWHALHYQGNISNLTRVEPSAEIPVFGGGKLIPPYSMSFELEWTIPELDTADETQVFQLSDTERYAYYDFCMRVYSLKEINADSTELHKGHHHLLGWDDLAFTDGRALCADESSPDPGVLYSGDVLDEETSAKLAREGKEWRLLFTVNTATFINHRWDFGWYPSFYIRDKDLLEGNLSNLWVIWEKF